MKINYDSLLLPTCEDQKYLLRLPKHSPEARAESPLGLGQKASGHATGIEMQLLIVSSLAPLTSPGNMWNDNLIPGREMREFTSRDHAGFQASNLGECCHLLVSGQKCILG